MRRLLAGFDRRRAKPEPDLDKPVSIFEIGDELRLQWIERGHKWSPRSEEEVERLVRERRAREGR